MFSDKVQVYLSGMFRNVNKINRTDNLSPHYEVFNTPLILLHVPREGNIYLIFSEEPSL